MAKRRNITCIKYNDSKNFGWVTHAAAEEAIDKGEAIEWNPKANAPEHADEPTMDSLKEDIIAYLIEQDIDHDAEKTKSELLDLI